MMISCCPCSRSIVHACYPISIMSSVSITLAHVLDDITRSIKTSPSLKKALSYRVVEILLVDLHYFQTVNQGSRFDSGTVRTDRHQVPEVIHEVLQKNGSPSIGKEHKYLLSGTTRADRQQVAKVVREVLPKRKSLLINVRGSDIGLEAVRAGQQVVEVISKVPPKIKAYLLTLIIGILDLLQRVQVANKLLKSLIKFRRVNSLTRKMLQRMPVLNKLLKSFIKF